MKYMVWDGAVRCSDRSLGRVWAPLGTGPDGGATYCMNDGIEFLEDEPIVSQIPGPAGPAKACDEDHDIGGA